MSCNQQLLELRSYADARGMLVSIEALSDVPFPIERVYYIVRTSGEARGYHAHRSLEQLLVCVAGSCRIATDDGMERREFRLDRPDAGLLIGRMVWREMHDFTPDSVLLVLASARHDERDYIHDYHAFLDELRSKGAE